jgi:predicted TIM-barrel fold metal-dependent hydrolase
MPGIRLHPNYHGYTLADPVFADLLRAARQSNLIVQLALALEDERQQHPLMRVAPVDPAPLPKLVRAVPGLKLVVLNRGRNPEGEALAELAAAGDVSFDLAMIEGAGCARALISAVNPKRVVFGSHFPFQYFEAAMLKLKESAVEGDERAAILSGNAARLLEGWRR